MRPAILGSLLLAVTGACATGYVAPAELERMRQDYALSDMDSYRAYHGCVEVGMALGAVRFGLGEADSSATFSLDGRLGTRLIWRLGKHDQRVEVDAVSDTVIAWRAVLSPGSWRSRARARPPRRLVRRLERMLLSEGFPQAASQLYSLAHGCPPLGTSFALVRESLGRPHSMCDFRGAQGDTLVRWTYVLGREGQQMQIDFRMDFRGGAVTGWRVTYGAWSAGRQPPYFGNCRSRPPQSRRHSIVPDATTSSRPSYTTVVQTG
jgi:hypothetical protein